MAASGMTGMVDATFVYFTSLGERHKDPAGIEAVRQVKDRMVRDLETLGGNPSKSELADLCRDWRGLRIETTGKATYPTDMFIESVCQVIELS